MAVNIGVNIQRSPNRINQALRDAGVNGQYPKLLFDFNDDYYLTNGSSKALSDVVTFTRNGNATMVDSDGLIKWAPHNYMPTPDNFSNISSGVSITAGQADPDGGTSAYRIDFISSGSDTNEFINTISGVRYTIGLKIKPDASASWVRVNIAGNSNWFEWDNNWATGVTGAGFESIDVTDLGSGWYYVVVSATATSTSSTAFGAYHAAGNGDANETVSTFYLYQVHAYRSDLGGMAPLPLSERAFQNDAYYEPDKPAIQAALLRAAVNLEPEKTLFNIEVDGRKLGDVNADGTVSSADALEYTRYVSGDTTYSTYIENVMHPYMVENSATYLAYLDERSSAYYVPTTSSAVYMPRIGHHKYNGDAWVDKGGLFESEARTNLVTYSNDFTQWTSSGSIETASQAVGRDGNSSLSFIENSSGGATGQTTAIVSVSGSTAYTLSLDLKDAGDNSIQRIGLYDTTSSWHGYIEISWSSGVPSTITNSGASNVNYENCGNGIYRLSFTVTTDATIGSTSFHIHPDRNGVIGAGVYAGFVSLEAASTPSSYIPTNGATVTRAAESITVPYANLPWPTPTYIGDELVTNGTFDTDVSGWTITGSGAVSWLVSSGSVYSSGQTSFSNYLYQEFTCEIGKIYSVSAEIITQGTNNALVKVGSTQTGGEVGNVWADGDGEGVFTFEFVATSTTHYVTLQEASGGTAHYYDNISVREINPLSVSIAMQGEMNYADDNSYTDSIMFDWNLNSDNYFQHRISTFGALTGQVNFVSKAGGVADIVYSDDLYQAGLNIPFDFASRHGSTFLNGAVDGIALTADTTPVALPDLSATDLKLAFKYNGTISSFRIWDRDIGDTGIAEATKPSTEPSLSLTFDGQPSSFTNGSLVV